MLASFFPHGMQHYLIGGTLIGVGVATLFVTTGRMGGVSTFFSAVWSYLSPASYFQSPSIRDGRNWRWLYSLGLMLGGALYALLGMPMMPTALPMWKLALGGVLIGFGARLGGGCTSGHGICGMASLNVGSMIHVVTFLTTGILVAHLLQGAGV